MAHPEEPPPLFSPNQVASSSREEVLHSIFSPTLQGGVTSYKARNDKGKDDDTQKRQEQKRERMDRAAKRVTPKTPLSSAPKKHVFIKTQPSELPPYSPHDEFFSPVGRNAAPFIPAKAVLKTPANLARSAFRSPRQTSPNFASPVSTISALTTASSCSFKSLPIDMLSFEYVSNCDSPEALQQIVDTLSADGSKQHYPSLLRKAKQQLKCINEQQAAVHHPNDDFSVHFSSSRNEAPKDSTLYVSSTKDESSLALSLSSSMLDGISVDVPPANTTANKVLNQLPTKIDTSNQMERMNGRQCVSIGRQELMREPKSYRSHADAAAREASLMSDIEQLTEEVDQLKSMEANRNVELQRKLKALEKAKEEAENKVTVLEKAVLSSSSHAREANVALANVREESMQLKALFDGERNAAQSEINDAKAIEQGLRQKIRSIETQLAQCKKQNADVAKSMESRFRRQVEKECTKRNADVRALQQSLQNAQRTTKAILEERSSTLRSIRHALGKSTDGVERLSALERKATVDSIAKKLSSSRAETKTLSKALTEAEIGRKRAIEARDAAKKQLQGLSSQCRRLEREHILLTRQVQELNDELESSKAYIATLLQSKDQNAEWERKEKEYQNVINNLKAQVRSGEASVSLALYRKAVDESRARAVECQDKRLEINSMSRKLQVLETRLKEKRKIQTRASPPEAQSSRPMNLRKVTPTSSANSNENYEPKTPSAVSKTQRERPPPPPPTPRISALREAGGRAGLCAKLKQMRRSPLVNKN